MVLGSTENTLGRSRIVAALKQQWPHDLLVCDGDRKRDRDRKMRAYVQGDTDEWEPEMHLNETAPESAWSVNESQLDTSGPKVNKLETLTAVV